MLQKLQAPFADRGFRCQRRGASQPVRERTNCISAYGRRSLWKEALEVLGGLREIRLAPDLVVFSATARATGGRGEPGRWRHALALLQQALLLQLQEELGAASSSEERAAWEQKQLVGCFGAAIGACASEGCWTQALHLLVSLQHLGLKADAAACSSAASACSRSSQWSHALMLFRFSEALGQAG
ncbi:unnamed protein product, partial [Polarella glacialis]